jgi:hypothetical protein
MQYTPPSIIATYAAVAVIQNVKGAGAQEIGTPFLSENASYESEE